MKSIRGLGDSEMQGIEIKIKGQIDQDWSDILAGLKITYAADGSTLLSGTIRDQSALYGLLFQLSNLGLQLVSLSSISLNNTGMGKGGADMKVII